MFRQAILRGHKHRTPRAAVADLQAKDVAIKRHRSFHVLYVKAQMTQRGYFWHKSSLQWTVRLLDGLAGVVNVSAERERTGVMECWSTGVRSYRIAIFTHLVFREEIDMEAKTAIVSPLRRFNEEKYYGICELG